MTKESEERKPQTLELEKKEVSFLHVLTRCFKGSDVGVSVSYEVRAPLRRTKHYHRASHVISSCF